MLESESSVEKYVASPEAERSPEQIMEKAGEKRSALFLDVLKDSAKKYGPEVAFFVAKALPGGEYAQAVEAITGKRGSRKLDFRARFLSGAAVATEAIALAMAYQGSILGYGAAKGMSEAFTYAEPILKGAKMIMEKNPKLGRIMERVSDWVSKQAEETQKMIQEAAVSSVSRLDLESMNAND